MPTAATREGTLFATGISPSHIEIILLGVAVVLLILLLAIKARRSHGQRKRKAASVGYHDFDAARYGHGAVGNSLIDSSVNARARPLAPSFVSPKKGATHCPGTAPSLAIPSSFGAVDRSRSDSVRSFDPEGVLPLRPPSDLPPRHLPPPPGQASTEQAPATGSTLPLLVQPPPPSPRASEATDR
jgi:hypothetical protein